MTDTPVATKPPLDDVMLAMDVVDTLRHRERVVERALSAEDQDRALVERLKEIYAGQGIAVGDGVIERGVRDLREDRFRYSPTPPSFARSLARLYVSRGRWGKPVALVAGVLLVVVVSYQVFVRGPEQASIAALPGELEAAYAAVVDLAEPPAVDAEAARILGDGERALTSGDFDEARAAIAELDSLEAALAAEYTIRVRQAPGELSGVWRIPDTNPSAQNYYLIVEAVDDAGDRLSLPITNEETGESARVRRWGQRVDESTFRAIAEDKQDDGIIQAAVLGEKRRGFIEPEFRAGVQTSAITDW